MWLHYSDKSAPFMACKQGSWTVDYAAGVAVLLH